MESFPRPDRAAARPSGMPVQLTARYTLTPAEALRGQRAFTRTRYIASLAVGLGLLVLGLAGAALVPAQRQPGVFLALAGLLFAGLPEVLLRRSLARRGDRVLTPVEITLGDDGIRLRTGEAGGRLGWEAIGAIRRRGGFWIFRLAANRALLVPERALAPAGNEALAAFLRGRAGTQE